ncbi:MAG: hypothetical protein WDN44_13690 [Sphingomonas sp.]
MPGMRRIASATFWSGSLPTSLAATLSWIVSAARFLSIARRSASRWPVTTITASGSAWSAAGSAGGASCASAGTAVEARSAASAIENGARMRPR